LSGIVVYTILTHYLPVAAGALLAGRQLWQEIFRRSVTPRQGTSTWQHDEASPPTHRFSGRSEV
jgi:hypothetical protein